LNATDSDVSNFIRIFTLKTQEEIEALEAEHAIDPGKRVLQKALADDITARVHSSEDLETAKAASEILFGRSTADDLMKLSEGDFLDIFEGVPQGEFSKTEIDAGVGIIELLVKSGFLSSNGEARRALQENSISINKNKVTLETTVGADQLLKGKYLLLQRGKKNYFVVKTA
jgi:tyrosyl-tRNA synthetase